MAYITVHSYDTAQDKFDNNGLAILMPTVCTIAEELNGTYELYLEHPIDKEGRWKYLEVDNIIKADGQLFRIISRNTTMSQSGEKVRSVNCLHIWYDLAGMAKDAYTSYHFSAYWFITNLKTDIQTYWNSDPQWNQGGWFKQYNFDFSTDCGLNEEGMKVAYAHIEPANIVSASIGTEASFVNVFSKEDANSDTITPELHRDNFSWSINWRKQGAVDNAFSITHTIDMIDVNETYDTSNYYTHLFAYDNHGRFKGKCINVSEAHSKGEHVPVQPKIKHIKIQYNNDEIQGLSDEQYWDKFNQDFMRYYRSICKPRLTLKCNYAELSDTDLYKDYISAKHCNVGDSGTVTCTDLGISQVMKVISKKYDLLDRKKIEITFGTKLASITAPEYMAQTLNNSKFTNAEVFSIVNID